ncbi:MAG TPA: alternative ribosome rescue aminoacyl-tRNA hydrolase ArfB [Fimbriiglobus sp.]|jgi:ribosome-associated protein
MQVSDTLTIPDDELTFTYARSGGPGGQNVNKVESKAVLRWDLGGSTAIPESAKARLKARHPSRVVADGGFLVVSQSFRDQPRNREECLRKLVEMIRAALVVPKVRRKTKPTKGSQRRRLDDKKKHGERKTARKAMRDHD